MVIFLIDIFILSLLTYAALSDWASTYLPDKEIIKYTPILAILKFLALSFQYSLKYAIKLYVLVGITVFIVYILHKFNFWASGEIFLFLLMLLYLIDKIPIYAILTLFLFFLLIWNLSYLIFLLLKKKQYNMLLSSLIVGFIFYLFLKSYYLSASLALLYLVTEILKIKDEIFVYEKERKKVELDDILGEKIEIDGIRFEKGKVLTEKDAEIIRNSNLEKIKMQEGIPLGPAFLLTCLFYRFIHLLNYLIFH